MTSSSVGSGGVRRLRVTNIFIQQEVGGGKRGAAPGPQAQPQTISSLCLLLLPINLIDPQHPVKENKKSAF